MCAQVPGTEHPGLIFVQPVSGFQVELGPFDSGAQGVGRLEQHADDLFSVNA